MTKYKPKEPTGEDCADLKEVWRDGREVAHALWFPQMGGYWGKAVAVFSKCNVGQCSNIDVYVWHDGDFPFTESGRSPRCIHFCNPDQFINFGHELKDLNAKVKRS